MLAIHGFLTEKENKSVSGRINKAVKEKAPVTP